MDAFKEDVETKNEFFESMGQPSMTENGDVSEYFQQESEIQKRVAGVPHYKKSQIFNLNEIHGNKRDQGDHRYLQHVIMEASQIDNLQKQKLEILSQFRYETSINQSFLFMSTHQQLSSHISSIKSMISNAKSPLLQISHNRSLKHRKSEQENPLPLYKQATR